MINVHSRNLRTKYERLFNVCNKRTRSSVGHISRVFHPRRTYVVIGRRLICAMGDRSTTWPRIVMRGGPLGSMRYARLEFNGLSQLPNSAPQPRTHTFPNRILTVRSTTPPVINSGISLLGTSVFVVLSLTDETYRHQEVQHNYHHL